MTPLDEAELVQRAKLARDAGRRDLAQERDEVGMADATHVELGTLKRKQQGFLRGLEEVEALEGVAVDGLGPDQSMQVEIAGGKAVACGEVFVGTAVTAEPVLAQLVSQLQQLPTIELAHLRRSDSMPVLS